VREQAILYSSPGGVTEALLNLSKEPAKVVSTTQQEQGDDD